MENEELEEIDEGTINFNNEEDGIILPGIEENEEISNNDDNLQNNIIEDNDIDKDKESLRKAMNIERKRRKEAERNNKALEERIIALEEAAKTPSKTTVEQLIEDGIDEDVAKSIALAIDKKQNDNSEIMKELENVKFENSLIKKSKEEGFENISDYSEEIKKYVDKGLTLDESYILVTQNSSKTRDTKSEIERKFEAKMQNRQARKEILGNYNDSKGATNNSKAIKITPAEKEMAIEAGMSIEEYVSMRDIENLKDYNKYTSMKKQ